MSTVSIGSQNTKKSTQRKMSNPEMIYSQSSQRNARPFKKRNQVNQRSAGDNGNSPAEVRQRIMSAQMHKVKNLQNKLVDAQKHLSELTTENKLLKQLQKKQDCALTKYEHSKSDLPQLLTAHDEDLRVWQAKCRQFKDKAKEASNKLKEKEQEYLTLTDQFKHLQTITSDKNLAEREQLANQVKELRGLITKKEELISVLQRKLTLETKNVKAQLTAEANRHKDTKKELQLLNAEVTRLLGVIETREKYIADNNSRMAARHTNSLKSSDSGTMVNSSKSSSETRLSLIPELETIDLLAGSLQGSEASTSSAFNGNRKQLKRRF